MVLCEVLWKKKGMREIQKPDYQKGTKSIKVICVRFVGKRGMRATQKSECRYGLGSDFQR